MATVFIDGQRFEADEHRNMLDVCLSLGFNLPYFCWHPAMGSVGACRQCAVKQFKDENDTQGKLVMACMTPAADGTRIAIEDQEARDFRAGVIEWLMVNHPHDCPICDEGGECHLQDMTVMTGHTYRRFRFDKRTYRNQYLGPFINHEMNRCIQCYRCVRFYREIAGGRDLNAFAAHDHVYFGRHEDGVLESPLAGNLVEVCPTGVFTDKTLKEHYTRRWDLQTAPSVCVHCSLGCNTTPGERYGKLRRIRARYHSQVNGHFLCDRGRYGYEFVNHERRLRQPLLPKGADTPAELIAADDAVERCAAMLSDPERAIGIGSPRASMEANFALRTLVGADRFCHGLPREQANLAVLIRDVLTRGPARSASLADVADCDAVLILGEDVGNTAPMLIPAVHQAIRRQPLAAVEKLGIPAWHDAAVREAIQDDKGPLFIATPAATDLDDIARNAFRNAPEEIARLGFAIAHALDERAPSPERFPPHAAALAETIADALRTANRSVVISGTGCGSDAVIQAAANVAWALDATRESASGELFLVQPECNTAGQALLGGMDLESAIAAVDGGAADTVIVLENDLYRRLPSADVDRLFAATANVVVLDHLATPTAARANVALPAATFAESSGTFVNNEGRAQRFFQVFAPDPPIQPSWRWLRDIARHLGDEVVGGWNRLDDVLAALAVQVPPLAAAKDAAPDADFRLAHARIPRQLHRYSGRTAMHAHQTLREPPPPEDHDSPMSFSMEGHGGIPLPQLAPEFWAPGWNSVQALTRFQEEVSGPLRGGEPGRRLIEPDAQSRPDYFDDPPPPFASRDGQWRIVPLHHVFGSEELSALSAGIAERLPAPYVLLHPDDAAALTVGPDEAVVLDCHLAKTPLAVRTDPALSPGLAGVPVGLPELPGPLPAWSRIGRA